jgi:gliding motility-associated-like protein
MRRLTTYKGFTRLTTKVALLFALLFSSFGANAQITTATAGLGALLNKFIGSNVTVLNPVLNCNAAHTGTFDAVGPTNLGLQGGIILSTGNVTDIDGNQTNGIGQTGQVNTSNPILSAISGFPAYDNCILEFDFTAELDTISDMHFEFVFASEEYPEWACSNFADVFAFIISGPGITGNQNIAVVPGTNIPISINSINMWPIGNGFPSTICNNMGPGSPFNAYYVDNTGGTTIAFDGFTTVLTATATPIQPCDTYHMFLGIANGSDHILQSGVFLKENSFTVDSTNTDFAGLVGFGEYVVEGCTPTSIVYSHDTSLGRPKKICFHYSSHLGAVNGVDYALLPDTLLIPKDVVSDSLVINPIVDGITETFYTWDVNGNLTSALTDTIVIYEINCCTLDTTQPKDSIKIALLDELYLHMITQDTYYCANNIPPTDLHATGDPLYNYLWTPSADVADPTDTTTNTLAGFPTQTTTYTITASYPGCPDNTEEVTIEIEPLPIVNVTPDNAALCLTEPYQINTTVDPPNSPYAYSWSPVDGNLSNTTIPNPTFWYPGPGVFTYTLSVTTPHGCEGRDSMTIESYPGVIGDIRIEDTSICSNDSLVIDVTVTHDSMTATSTYAWSPSLYLNNPNIMEPTYKTTVNEALDYTYTLITTNSYGCHDTDQITIHALVLPEIKIMNDTALCLHEPTQIMMTVGPEGGQFTYDWTPTSLIYGSANVKDPFFWHPFNTDHADYQLYAMVTEVTGGCRNFDTINIHTYPHVFLETIDDQLIRYGSKVELWANNTGVSDMNFYAWEPPAYLNNPNVSNPVALGQETVLYTVYGWNNWGCRDTADVNVVVDPTMDEFVPSVFSPNNDGKNDVFRILNMRYQKLVEFKVFNRWGKLLYDNTDATKGWDGTFNGVPQDPGVYNYIIRVNVPSAEQKVYKGTVTLVR